jgi:altronate hydrolase
VRYGEMISSKGLIFMDSPGFDPASVTGQVASGANVICFTTGRGSAFGFKPVPSLKLTTNTAIFERMNEDMDINCGDILEGTTDVQRKGEEIFKAVLAVASGAKTKSELLDYGDNEFTPWQIGAMV